MWLKRVGGGGGGAVLSCCLRASPSSSFPAQPLRRRLQTSHGWHGEESAKTYGALRPRLRNEEDAKRFLAGLRMTEKDLLRASLCSSRDEKERREESSAGEDRDSDEAGAISEAQAKSLFLVNCLPFVGFGFLDNLIMIVAGEYIDAKLGLLFGLSTMAAAGLGNIISDVAGVGLAHYVEGLVSRLGISAPTLSREQWESRKARRAANLGKILGLVIGCVIGMFPLLFIDHSVELEAKANIHNKSR